MRVLNHEVWNGVLLTDEPVPVFITLITERLLIGSVGCKLMFECMYVRMFRNTRRGLR